MLADRARCIWQPAPPRVRDEMIQYVITQELSLILTAKPDSNAS
jgi:hypothetical protein